MIAVVTGAAFYVGSYYTETVSQCVGNDLRVRLYHHLQELSLAYYDTTRVGTILSTLTSDVQTIQSFASTSTLNIFTDTLTLAGMIIVMFWLRWDFALIALAVTPLLAIFVFRVNKAIKTAVKEVRTRQSDLLATLQEGLQSIEVVQAFSREEHQEHQLRTASMDTVTAWLKARRVSSLLSPIVGLVIAVCTGLVLWRGCTAHPGRHDDGGRTDRLSRLPGQVLPTGARPRRDDQHHRAGVGGVPAGARGLRRRQNHSGTCRPERAAAVSR